MAKKTNNWGKRLMIMVVITSVLVIALSGSSLAQAIDGPIILSDQGTNVIYKSTGLPVESANLTIEVWDAATSGFKFYDYTFINAIKNGSWNVMLGESPGPDLNLTYNQH